MPRPQKAAARPRPAPRTKTGATVFNSQVPPATAPADSTPTGLRARIVAAARAHFFAHGFRSVTTEELAREMGISKKTLYVHYATKRELLEAAIDAKIGDLDRALEAAAPAGVQDFETALAALLAAVHAATREITPAFARDLAREDPALIAHMKERRRAVIGRSFNRLLSLGQKSGHVRDDIPADFQIEALLALADAIVTPEYAAARGTTPRETAPKLLSLFLHGALTRASQSRPALA